MMPSDWVARWAGLIPAGGPVLDLACGAGRHAVFLAGLGHPVTAVDIDLAPAEPVRHTPGIVWIQADLEGAPWPFAQQQFAGIVVSRYLHRPLLEPIFAALAPGGALIYETFAIGQMRYGRPRNPAHLLLSGELLEYAHGRLLVRAFEDADDAEARQAMQRLAAVRP